MAAIVKVHVATPGEQADAILEALRENTSGVTETDADAYEVYLASADVEHAQGVASLRELLDREAPDWRDVMTMSG